MYKVDAEYFHGRGLVSSRLKAAADAACGPDWADPLPEACEAAYGALSDALGSFNIDNVDDFCPHGAGHRAVPSLRSFRAASWRERRAMRRHAANANTTAEVAAEVAAWVTAAPDSAGEVIGDVAMWCGADAAASAWKAAPSVIAALHVVGGEHNFDYNIQRLDLRPLYRDFALARPGLNFLVYNGQSDANVPFNGQVDLWVPANATVESEWEPWSVGKAGKGAPTAGHVRTYSPSFRFAVVSGAGHEVPTYRPQAALSMLQQFLLPPAAATTTTGD